MAPHVKVFKKLHYFTSKNLQSQVSIPQTCHTPPLFTSFINCLFLHCWSHLSFSIWMKAFLVFVWRSLCKSYFGAWWLQVWIMKQSCLLHPSKANCEKLYTKMKNLNFREKTQIKTTLYLNWCRNSKILKNSLLQCISYIYIMPGWWCNRTQIRLTERFLLSLHPPLKRSAENPLNFEKMIP